LFWRGNPLIPKRKRDPQLVRTADAAAKRITKKYGPSAGRVLTDFEWGMINGKLSAIRWMLGEDWDFLDM